MELRAFLELNEAMALRALLDQVLLVEQVWEAEEARQAALAKLLDLLEAAGLHRSPSVAALRQLAQRLPPQPSYQQFLALFVPIERQHGRLLADADFLVRSSDSLQRKPRPEFPALLILDNIRSAFNVGSILRLAESLGIAEVHLCGYTARPDQDKVARAAMGAEAWVHWEWHAHARTLVESLKTRGIPVFALETAETAPALEVTHFPLQRLALLAGNERFGLERSLLELCQGLIEIPSWGQKNSLNVAVSVGIATFELRRQWLASGFIAGNLP